MLSFEIRLKLFKPITKSTLKKPIFCVIYFQIIFSHDVTNLLKSVFRIPSLPVLIQRNRSISVIRRTEKLKNTGERRGTHSSSPKKTTIYHRNNRGSLPPRYPILQNQKTYIIRYKLYPLLSLVSG